MSEKDRRPPLAVALHYEGRDAPRVTAKGWGEVGEAIIALARQHDVPLEHDPEMAGFLAQVDIGQEIPPALYRAVAEVLAFVYMANGKAEEMFARSQADKSSSRPGRRNDTEDESGA